MVLDLEKGAFPSAGWWRYCASCEGGQVYLGPTINGEMEHEIECGICSDVAILVFPGEEGVKPKDKALKLLVNLQSHPHL